MVSQATLGAIYHYATRPRRARFNQLAYVRTVERWREAGRFAAVADAASEDPALVFDFSWRRTGVGSNGYPSGFELTYSVDADYIREDAEAAARDVLQSFGAALVDAVYEAIESDCPDALTVREYGVVVVTRTASEAAAADAFDLETDAVRGLLAAAEAELEAGEGWFAASLERFADLDDASFAVTTDLVGTVSESELPVGLTDEGYVSYAPTVDS